MSKYELAICVVDEPETLRKKEGDILAICAYPWNWGLKEIDQCLIVIVEFITSMSIHELRRKFKGFLYTNGLEYGFDFCELIYEDRGIDPKDYPDSEYDWDLRNDKPILKPTIVGKHKFNVPLTGLGSIDLTKVRNKNYKYQPFKKASQLVQKFDGKGKNKSLSLAEVDCGLSPEVEVSKPWEVGVNLIKNKHTNLYIQPGEL